MQLQNKNRIAYLGALTLLFSYAEMLLPRFVPFFRLGLGNIVILVALDLDFPSFFVLTIIKSLASSIMNGTLISPFFLISISQSVISGLLMFALFKLKKNWLGLYGISLCGGAISALVQLGLSALYLGNGTISLLGPMLLFSLIASIVTATCALFLKIPDSAPELKIQNNKTVTKYAIPSLILILASSILILSNSNLILLSIGLISAFIFQLISGRKIKLLPHISIWLFVILVSLFSPSGKIFFKIANFPVTKGALKSGLGKALKLSTVASLSQCAAAIKPASSTLLALTLNYFSALQEAFKTFSGNLFARIKLTLQTKNLTLNNAETKSNSPKLILTIVMFCVYLILFTFSHFVKSL